MSRNKGANSLSDFINADLARSHIEPDEITIRDLVEARGLTYSKAERLLERAIRAGQATKRLVRVRGHMCWAYTEVKK